MDGELMLIEEAASLVAVATDRLNTAIASVFYAGRVVQWVGLKDSVLEGKVLSTSGTVVKIELPSGKSISRGYKLLRLV